MSITLATKLANSLLGFAVAIVASRPQAYRLTDAIFGNQGTIAIDGCPTTIGHILHTVVFFVLIIAIFYLFTPSKTIWTLVRYSFYCAAIYFLATSPAAFKYVNDLTKGAVNKCPTWMDMMINTVVTQGMVYIMILFVVFYFPSTQGPDIQKIIGQAETRLQ